MVIIILLIVAILGVVLFDYFLAKNWNEVQYTLETDNEAVLARHRRANALRKAYIQVLGVTVIGLVGFSVAAIVATESFAVGTSDTAVIPPDTIQMTLPAPPLEPIKTVPEHYKVEGNAGIDQDAQNEQEEIRESEVADPKNEADQSSEKSEQVKAETRKPYKLDDPNVKATDKELIEKGENQYRDMVERSKQRAAQREQQRLEQLKKQQEGNKTKTNPNQVNSTSGTASVDWNHDWRKAYKNDDSFLRTPEYRCPNGVSGKVKVKVRVNSNGNVISAEPIGNSAAVNPCLVENAVEYAYKSRFEISSKSADEGVITYTYHP